MNYQPAVEASSEGAWVAEVGPGGQERTKATLRGSQP